MSEAELDFCHARELQTFLTVHAMLAKKVKEKPEYNPSRKFLPKLNHTLLHTPIITFLSLSWFFC